MQAFRMVDVEGGCAGDIDKNANDKYEDLRSSFDPPLLSSSAYHASSPPAAPPYVTSSSPISFDAELPKFCCLVPPSKTCCCGCTLQAAMYFFAVFKLVTGAIAFMNFLANAAAGIYFFSFSAMFSIFLGVTLWKAARDLDVRYAKIAYYAKIAEIVCEVCVIIVWICFIAMENSWKRVIDREIEHQHAIQPDSQPLTPEEEKNIEKTVFLIFHILFVYYVICVLVDFYFLYIFWSFKSRLQRGETLLITTGVPPSADSSALPLNSSYVQNYSHAYPPAYPPAYPAAYPPANPQGSAPGGGQLVAGGLHEGRTEMRQMN